MDITETLAQIWGPMLIAIGVGILFSANYYKKIYRDLESEPLAVLGLGMVLMAVGIMQVLVHNVWASIPQIVISLVAWGTLLKGVVLVTFPRLVDQVGNKVAVSGIIPVVSVGALALGAYITWIGYFS